MTVAKVNAPAQATQAFPDDWADACKHLMKKDRVMKRLIPQFGDASLSSRGDAFSTLARSSAVSRGASSCSASTARGRTRSGMPSAARAWKRR